MRVLLLLNQPTNPPTYNMNYSLNDTIAAVATAPGEAGIGIVRISGNEALRILKRVFRPASKKWHPKSHRMVYGQLVNRAGQPLDEVMAVWFQKPRSYTREDVVELHAHGGTVAVRQALGLVLQAGARLSEAGEMTLRSLSQWAHRLGTSGSRIGRGACPYRSRFTGSHGTTWWHIK